jgi:hypothetical protein
VSALLVTLGSIAPVGSGIIRHVPIPVLSLAMDHPGQGIANSSCHEEREERIFCRISAHKALPLTNVVLSLGVVFSCLPHVAFAPAVYGPSDLSGTSGDIVERLPHLIQNVLG